jgi:ParB family chromosome partitioning protein
MLQMGTQPRGLGRGLGALIPPASEATRDISGALGGSGAIFQVPVADIVPNPRQPRAAMPPETLAELADSIREHGVIQPIIVRQTETAKPESTPGEQPMQYEIIAGERRWRAARLAGLSRVPVIVKGASPRQALELALVENIQRSDLNALEEAEAFRALMVDFGLNQGEVAEKVGKSRVAVANTMRLLGLPEAVKALLIGGALSEGHARALLALPQDDLIAKAADQVVARELSVRETEELVRRLLAAGAAAASSQEEPSAPVEGLVHTRQLEDEFRRALGTKVSLTRGPRGGKLVISFYSEEELQGIYDRIIGS